MKRYYLTIDEHGRHIQRADINEDNYVCNVESSDEDAEHIMNCINSHDDLLAVCKWLMPLADIYEGDLEWNDAFVRLEQVIDKAEKNG